mgnify:CR=1 FL=1
MIDYILAYISVGILGYIIERYFMNKVRLYGDTLNEYLGIKIPFIHIWGLGGVILLFLYKTFPDDNMIMLSIISGITMSLLECVVGNISLQFNGYQTWNYNNRIQPMCHGYVSMDITLYWIIASYIFFRICEHIIPKN